MAAAAQSKAIQHSVRAVRVLVSYTGGGVGNAPRSGAGELRRDYGMIESVPGGPAGRLGTGLIVPSVLSHLQLAPRIRRWSNGILEHASQAEDAPRAGAASVTSGATGGPILTCPNHHRLGHAGRPQQPGLGTEQQWPGCR